MTQETVNGKIALNRLFHWVEINPLFEIDNAEKAMKIVFDFPKIATEKPLKKKSMEIIVSTLEVDYDTALNKVVAGIETHPSLQVDEGIESLAVIFDIPGRVVEKDIEERIEERME